MRVFRAQPQTSRETIRRFRALADRIGPCEAAAKAWSDAGFDDELTARWLAARCFDPDAARALGELGVLPEQATARTRDGGDYLDTIAFKVASGDLSPRQGAARCLSSR